MSWPLTDNRTPVKICGEKVSTGGGVKDSEMKRELLSHYLYWICVYMNMQHLLNVQMRAKTNDQRRGGGGGDAHIIIITLHMFSVHSSVHSCLCIIADRSYIQIAKGRSCMSSNASNYVSLTSTSSESHDIHTLIIHAVYLNQAAY